MKEKKEEIWWNLILALSPLKTEQSLPSAPTPWSSNVFKFLKTVVRSDWIQREPGCAVLKNNALVMHCSTLCYITLITALLQLSSQQKKGNAVALSFISGMVSAQVREGYISSTPPSPLQLLSNNSISLSLWIYFAFGVFCSISLHFLCPASPFPDALCLSLHICLFA